MTAQNTKSRIASGFYRVIERLGGMSDTLSIAGSYGDTLTDEQVADELEAWLAANPLRPQPSGETREAVARIVDPKAWATWDHQSGEIDRMGLVGVERNGAIMSARSYVLQSLKKTDAILALLSARPLALGGQQGEEATVPASEYHRRGVSIINLTEHAGAHLCRAEKAEAKIARLSGGHGVEAEVEDAWSRLLDADDRTSPPEYPEHCLITKGELAGFMGDAAFIARTTPARAEAQDEGAAGDSPNAVKRLVDAALTYISGVGHAPGFGPLGALHEAAWAVKKSTLYAHPSPTPAADADRVRIAAAASKRIIDAYFMDDDYDANGALRKVSKLLDAALKSTAAKEGGE